MIEKQHVCSLRHRQNETLVNPSTKQRQNPCPTCDLSMCHDWPVEKDIDDLPIRLKGNAKHTSRNFTESIEGPEQ